MKNENMFWEDINENLKDPEFRRQYEKDLKFFQRCFNAGWLGGVAMRLRRKLDERKT